MARRDEYRAELRRLPDEQWNGYLAERSNLPGPRANLELAAAVADEAPAPVIRLLSASDDELLALCGAAALGRLSAEEDVAALGELRRLASDPRWRVREGVAIGLQRLGAADMPRLLMEMRVRAAGSALEQRAAVAALCEPPLLRDRASAREVLDVSDGITESLASRKDRSSDGFRSSVRRSATAGASPSRRCPKRSSQCCSAGRRARTGT